MRVVKPWIALPREAVECPSLQIFRTYLYTALSNLILFRRSLALSRKLEQIISRGPFQPKLLLALWKQKQARQSYIQHCSVIPNHRNHITNKKDYTEV